MRRVVILVTEVVLPIAVAIILAAVFRTVYVSEDGCNFLWLWFLNVMFAGLIGGVVLVWRVIKGIVRCLIA